MSFKKVHHFLSFQDFAKM
uniref:Uncharacterized protein n=1 Tax=Anguilla anguilla TaxID=7936 RepID=A0A0E9U2P2_ANGAN